MNKNVIFNNTLIRSCMITTYKLANSGLTSVFLLLSNRGILGNEEADKLARQASAMPLLGPEPALGIPKCLAREATKNWTEYQHHSARRDLPDHRNGKIFIGRPCEKRA
jgi:hypothetical protein